MLRRNVRLAQQQLLDSGCDVAMYAMHRSYIT